MSKTSYVPIYTKGLTNVKIDLSKNIFSKIGNKYYDNIGCPKTIAPSTTITE